MPFVWDASEGFWTGSGDLNDQSDWFDVTSTGELVSAPYPADGTGFGGGGTLAASGDFPFVGIEEGAYVITGNLITNSILVGVSGAASLTLSDGATVNVSAYVNVAYSASGELTIQDGANVSFGGLAVANSSGVTGAVDVSGASLSAGSLDVRQSARVRPFWERYLRDTSAQA
jgi:hypothetical protein